MDNIVVILPIISNPNDPNSIFNKLSKSKLKMLVVVANEEFFELIKRRVEKRNINLIKARLNTLDHVIMTGIEGIKRFYPGIGYVLFADIAIDYQLNTLADFYQRLENGSDLVLGLTRKGRRDVTSYNQLVMRLMVNMIRVLLSKKLIGFSSFMMLRYDLLKNLNPHPQNQIMLIEIIVKCLALDLKVDQVFLKSSATNSRFVKSPTLIQSIKNSFEVISLLKYSGFRLDNKTITKLQRR